MKRIIYFMLSIILIVSLVSCERKNETVIKGKDREFIYITRRNNGYGDGRIIGAASNVDDSNLQYLNYDDMSRIPLCSKPNCNHRNKECVSKAIGTCPILYNNYIYFFVSTQNVEETGHGERKFVIDSKLCRISLDTSEIENIVSFTDCVPRDYDGCLLLNGVLWFTGDDMNPIINDYGVIQTSNMGGEHFLCSIELEKGKYNNYGSIYNGKNYDLSSHATILGYYNSNILINYEYASSSVCFDSEKEWFGMTELMYEFNPLTNEIRESELPNRPVWFNSNSNTMIFRDTNTKKIIILDNGKEFTYNDEIGDFATFFNNKLFIRDTGKWYDYSDNSEHSLGKYSESWEFIDYYDNCYIVTNYKEYIKLTEEELLTLDKE